MSKKRIMRTLTIKEIAGVDRPAQAGAKAVIMKRHSDNDEDDDDELEDATSERERLEAEKSAGTPGGGPSNKETKMTDQEKAVAKELEAAKTELEASKAELATAKAICALSDMEKAHYNSLDETAKVVFLKQDSKARASVLEELTKADAIVYKDADGVEYRKSDDPRLVAAAKRADAAMKSALLADERAQNSEFAKRAETELTHLPGDNLVKIAVLKALDGITDEEIRTKAIEMLKANNTKVASASSELGSRNSEFSKAEDELEAMAKKYAEDHKVSMSKARVEVLSTKEGSAAYLRTLPSLAGASA